ncbi:MAG: hypothetical protein WC860_08690, partial [Candidatus Margulisiibacteriota bacterium]
MNSDNMAPKPLSIRGINVPPTSSTTHASPRTSVTVTPPATSNPVAPPMIQIIITTGLSKEEQSWSDKFLKDFGFTCPELQNPLEFYQKKGPSPLGYQNIYLMIKSLMDFFQKPSTSIMQIIDLLKNENLAAFLPFIPNFNLSQKTIIPEQFKELLSLLPSHTKKLSLGLCNITDAHIAIIPPNFFHEHPELISLNLLGHQL